MAKYIERESLEKDIKQYSHARIDNGAIDQMGFQFVEDMCSILRIIEKQPTADVVEVVRCKDCQHARQTVYGNYHCLVDHRLAHEETDYCSYGERKEGAE